MTAAPAPAPAPTSTNLCSAKNGIVHSICTMLHGRPSSASDQAAYNFGRHGGALVVIGVIIVLLLIARARRRRKRASGTH